MIEVTNYTDPGCPWAYSAEPFLTALRWRYGDALRWRRVMIGLADDAADYDQRGYVPERSARGRIRYARRFRMPFSYQSRLRNMATGLACRAVKAAELQSEDLAEALLRMLRFGYFTTDLLMDTTEAIRTLADQVAGLDTQRLLDDMTGDAVQAAYASDRAEARTAVEAGRPAMLQGKTAATDGPERFTAPSLVFRRNGSSLVAGGWQTLEAYDVLVANLAPDTTRRGPATPAELLGVFRYGLTTYEVAVSCTATNDPVDADAALAELISLAHHGRARRVPLGDDALWLGGD